MEKILAIDVGTTSLSAAIAEKHPNGKFFVCDFWKLPYDVSDSKNASRVLFGHLKLVFSEASKFHSGIIKVVMGFAYPLHLEKIVSGEFKRENPSFPVSVEELENAVQILKNQHDGGLFAISHDIWGTKINGYSVENSLGYNGEFLDIKVNFLTLSLALKNHLEDLKDKFFPSSEFKCFSDFSVLKKAVLRFFSSKKEFAILDIGGEVSVFENFVFPFGVRQIEKRIGSALNRFSCGYLDYQYERSVSRILKSHSDILRDALRGHNYSTVFLTGGGANFSEFFDAVKNGSTIEIKKL